MAGNVFFWGTLFKPLVFMTAVNNGKTFNIGELLNGIIQLTGTGNTNFILPSVSIVYGGVTTVLTTILKKSFERGIINIGSFTCTLSAATAHTGVGSAISVSNTSARFITIMSAVNVAIT